MNKRSIKVFVLCVLFMMGGALHVMAQKHIREQNIPMDSAVVYGKLANGLTYYIRRNTSEPGKVFFKLVVKVGHSQQTDNQREFAHLIEHMAFQETKNLPRATKYFSDKAGLRYGTELSAGTVADHTHYYLTIPNSPDLINDALRYIKDWAVDMQFDKEITKNEANVVIQELKWRGEAGVNVSKYHQQIDLYPNSAYYFGRYKSIDNLSNLKLKDLKSFYKDWYRPNLQAVIVAGDIEVEEIKQKISEMFNELRTPKTPPIEIQPNIDESNHFVELDAESSSFRLDIYYKQKMIEAISIEDYRKLEVVALYNRMVQSRFLAIQRETGSYLGSHRFFNGGKMPGVGGLHTRINFNYPEELKPKLDRIVVELERIRKYGFTRQEFEVSKKEAIREASDQKSLNLSNEGLVNIYLNHFVNDDAAPSPFQKYELQLSLIEDITLSEVNAVVDKWFSDRSRDIVIEAPTGTIDVSEIKIVDWVRQVRNWDIPPYNMNKPMVDLNEFFDNQKLSHKENYQVSEIPGIDVTEMKFQNGVKIIFKPIANHTEEISIYAYKKGGDEMFSPKNYLERKISSSVIHNNGVGGFTKDQLDKFKKESGIKVTTFLSKDRRGIIGTGPANKIESILQLVNLHCVAPNKNEKAFQGYITKQIEDIKEIKPTSAAKIFTDSMAAYRNCMTNKLNEYTSADYNRLQFNKVYQAYQLLYGNIEGYTFIVTGKVNLPEIIPLFQKYIASIEPSQDKLEDTSILDTSCSFIKGPVSKKIYAGNGEQARIDLYIRETQPYSEKEHLGLMVLRSLLSDKLMGRLRDKEGLVYFTWTGYYRRFDEVEFYINYNCEPQHAEQSILFVLEEIRKLKLSGPNLEELESNKMKVVESALNFDSSQEWERYLIDRYFYNLDPGAFSSYSKIIEQLSVEDIKQVARKYLNEDHLMQFVLLPENAKQSEESKP